MSTLSEALKKGEQAKRGYGWRIVKCLWQALIETLKMRRMGKEQDKKLYVALEDFYQEMNENFDERQIDGIIKKWAEKIKAIVEFK
jgi:hypothetical protein